MAGLPLFPSPFMHYDYGVGEPPKTLHEMKLMDFEGAVCDKPGWFSKLGDEAIVARWRAEARKGSRPPRPRMSTVDLAAEEKKLAQR